MRSAYRGLRGVYSRIGLKVNDAMKGRIRRRGKRVFMGS